MKRQIYELGGITVRGYVLMSAAVGKEKDVREAIESLDRITKIDIVTGPYDLIAVAESEDISTLTSTLLDEIRKVDGVEDTSTSVVIE